MFFGGLNGDGFGEEYEYGWQGRYEVGEDRASYSEPKTRCKYCGQNNLYWHKVNGRYRLYTSNSHHTNEFIHSCENYKKLKTNYSPCLGTGDRDFSSH